MSRFHQSQTHHSFWMCRFDPRFIKVSVVDDFGNLYPVRVNQLQISLLG